MTGWKPVPQIWKPVPQGSDLADMIVGVISDTHDRLPMIDAGLDVFAGHGAEALIHPGDLVAPFAMRRLLKFDGPAVLEPGRMLRLGDGPMHRRPARHGRPECRDY